MTSQAFERDIVNAFNRYFSTSCIDALAYRRIQTRYQPQQFDVLVDSYDRTYYLAIECKSIDVHSTGSLYFSQHFHNSAKGHQVELENRWLNNTGRLGFLVVEARRGSGHRTSCYFIPWRFVYRQFAAGKPGINSSDIVSYPCLYKSDGIYLIDNTFITSLTTVSQEHRGV